MPLSRCFCCIFINNKKKERKETTVRFFVVLNKINIYLFTFDIFKSSNFCKWYYWFSTHNYYKIENNLNKHGFGEKKRNIAYVIYTELNRSLECEKFQKNHHWNGDHHRYWTVLGCTIAFFGFTKFAKISNYWANFTNSLRFCSAVCALTKYLTRGLIPKQTEYKNKKKIVVEIFTWLRTWKLLIEKVLYINSKL